MALFWVQLVTFCLFYFNIDCIGALAVVPLTVWHSFFKGIQGQSGFALKNCNSMPGTA